MPHDHPFRFGIQAKTSGSPKSWRELATAMEGLGYSSLLMPDHFDDQLAPIPALMSAADATSVLRVGSLVFGNDYRHPVVLAKEVASLDWLTDGRVEVGLGAGWMASDYSASGIAMESPRVRIERLSEAVQILKGIWSNETFSYQGAYYSVSNVEGFPRPLQQPHPPLILGGGGKKILTLAARYADIVGINPAIPNGRIDEVPGSELTAGVLTDKVELVRSQAASRWDQLEINIMVFAVSTGSNSAIMRDRIADQFEMTPDEIDSSPYAWFGESSQVIDKLRAARERWGISYFVLHGEEAMRVAAPIVAELAGT